MQELSEAAKLAKWPSFPTTRDCLQTLAIKKRIRIGRNIRDYISFFALVAGIETGFKLRYEKLAENRDSISHNY